MKVKIKTWRALERKFGLDEEGDINCQYIFTKDMEEVLPEDRIIEVERGIDVYFFETETTEWWISDDMIEKVIEEDE